jgi:hypothetical protein
MHSGSSETVVTEHDGMYTAAFPPVTVSCPSFFPSEDSGVAHRYDTYTLWWSANRHRINVIEHEDFVSGDCPGTARKEWLAVRLIPGAAVPAPGP